MEVLHSVAFWQRSANIHKIYNLQTNFTLKLRLFVP
jgi:hypothetical protein